MGTGKVGHLTRAGITPRRTAVLTVLGLTVIVGALLFPFAAPAHDASDFFIFARAQVGPAAENTCNGTPNNDKQADVSGSNNLIHGRIHSNADYNAGGQTNVFNSAVTYGTHNGNCAGLAGVNSYPGGGPTDLNGATPTGVTGGWPGDLNSYLTGGLTFSSIAQALPGESCSSWNGNPTSLSGSGTITLTAADNNKVICNGTGLVKLAESDVTLKITILSHGPIEISGQNNTLTPYKHGILAFTDYNQTDFPIKLAGSNFTVPEQSILFAPRAGIDTSGSDDSEMCIQLIGQGWIRVPGSKNILGPGSSACKVQPPDVSVAKTPDSQTINAGEPATFSITVTNNGPGASTVTLNDNLPVGSGGLNWSEDSDPSNSCSVSPLPASPQVLSCNFGSVPANQSRTVSVTTQTDTADCATLNNTVTITPSGDTTPGNNSDTGSITIRCPDVSVLKTGNGTITAGGNAQFTMVITNNGPGTATGVGLTDNLPGTGWAITSQTAGNCSVDTGGDNLTCTGITLTASATYSVTVERATVAPADCGPMQNTAAVTAPGDTNSNNNVSSATVLVNCPDISVEKTGNGPITAGDEAQFTMVITNNGPGTATGVTLDDDLPGAGWSISSQTAGNCSVDGTGSMLDCTGITLTQGATYSVTVVKTTTNADCGPLENTVLVSATNEGTNQQNNTDSATILVNCPDITVTKTGNGTITAGDTATFTIVITNLGPGTATGVGLNDPLPGAGWSIDSQSAGNLCSVDGTGENLTCSGITLAKDATYTVVVSRATSNADCADLENTATVFGSNEGANTNNNTSTDTVVVNCPDVTVDKVGNGPLSAGETAEFTMTIINNGPGQATNVGLTDDLPGAGGWALGTQTGSACTLDGAGNLLTCTGITLAQGGQYNVTVTKATSNADCAGLDNTAQVTAGNEDPSKLGNNSDSAQIVVNCPDITVTKDGNGPIQVGETAQFTIVIKNNGPGQATGVSLDDTLVGAGWSIFSQSGTACAIDAGELSCDGITLAQGGEYQIVIRKTTTLADCADLPNTATVSATNENPQGAAPNSASDTVVVLCADVLVQKTPDAGVVQAGDLATFTITVTNSGDGSSTVSFDDQLPDGGLDWSTTTPDCAVVGTSGDQDLECSFTLAANSSKVITVSSPTTAAGTCGVKPNTVTITASGDISPNNNSDDAQITVQCPDVSVQKTPDQGTAHAGDQITFSIVVTNAGPGAAANVGLTDTLPTGFEWQLGGPDQAACLPFDGVTLDCDFGTVAEGGTRTVTLTSDTTAADCGPVVNTANVSATGDITPANNTDQGQITIECPDVSVEKTPNNGVIQAGDTATFTIVVTNSGDSPSNVSFDDQLPGVGLDWSTTTPDCAVVGTPGDQDLECSFTLAGGGAQKTITVSSATGSDSCGVKPNTVTITASGDISPNNNTDDAQITVQCPDVSVEKTPNAGVIQAGDTATFTIVVTNSGTGSSTVSFDDQLPDGGLDWSTTTPDCAVVGTPGDQDLECSFTLAGGGAQKTITVSSPTTGASCGVKPNTVTITASGDISPNNNTDSGQITIQCPDVSVVKTPDQGSVDAGDPISFSITVTNNGPGAAANVTLTDTLPTGFTWQLGGPDAEACLPFDGVTLDCDFGTVDDGEGSTRTITLTSDTTAEDCRTVVNTANVSATGDITPANNADQGSVTVECGQIIVRKETNPDGDPKQFEFDPSYGANFLLSDGQSNNSGPLAPGGYDVSEIVPVGWDLTGISCGEGTESDADTAFVFLNGGETITCVFTNTKRPAGVINVIKTADPTSIKEPGGLVNFTVTVENTGPVNVTINSVVDDKFGDLANVAGGSPSGCFAVPFVLTPGQSSTCTFPKNVTGTAGTSHVNVVTASGFDTSQNPVSDSDDATVVFTERLIDLVIVKDATSPTPLNEIVTYTMTITNKGPDTATNVQVADPAPAGIRYLSVVPGSPTCTVTTALLTCSLGTLEVGQSRTVTLTARATVVGRHTNTATVTGSGGRETNPADNVDTAVTVVPAPITPQQPKPQPKPKPKALPCLTLTVTPRMVTADGNPDTLRVRVTAGKKRVKGTKVRVFGAGVKKATRSNAKGMATVRINPRRPGLITITAAETRQQQVCGPKRIGAVGVFLPPLTG
jgi:uncharacterized repeat protein (TIGR01451 family)